MDKKNLTWNKENDLIIEQIFEALIKNSSLSPGERYKIDVELYLTASCNQKCEYCYLTKYGDKLYPLELRDQKTILNNLQILLSYFLEKKYDIKSFDIFSGEVWSSDFGISVLEMLLEYTKTSLTPPTEICIPSNCSFILNEPYFNKIKELIEAFSYYGVRLVFSASIDGPILEETNRSFKDVSKNILRDEEFYTKLFNFCKTYNYGFHPMVNAFSIENWPQQYSWWLDKFKEYDFNYYSHIMFLEVRNDEWSQEKIVSYLSFLNYAYEEVKNKIFDGNALKLLKSCLNIPQEDINDNNQNYFHLRLTPTSSMMGCTVDREIMIRLGDLSWVPCHRTSYDKFKYGEFKVENNKIIGLKALNLPLLFSIYGVGYQGHPKCDTCSIGSVCVRGCYGAQFEAHQELFYPCESVCSLLKAKTLFLLYKFKKENEVLKDPSCQKKLDALSAIIESEELKNLWLPTINKLLI